MTETKVYQYGNCHKCGARLTPEDLVQGRVLCLKCRVQEWRDKMDGEGWV